MGQDEPVGSREADIRTQAARITGAAARLQKEPDYEVEVYCDRHGRREPTVQIFQHIAGGWGAVALTSTRRARESVTRVRSTGEVWGSGTSPEEPPDLHEHYTLECTLCPAPRLNVQRRGERLHSELDRLAHDGESRITLADLAAILG